MALLLVLVALVVAAVLAATFLGAQSTTIGIAGNIDHHSQARYVAESGLELAIAYVRDNDNWRTDQSHGTWVTDESSGAGTFTVLGEDGEDTDGDGTVNGDGDLSDDSDDLLTLTVTGKVNGTSHVVRAVLTPEGQTGLVGHWKLDETSGTTAPDASGNNNHATLYGMDPASDWVTGAINGALDFDGSNDYVQVPHSPELNGSSELTYAAWVYPRNWSGLRQVFAKSVHGGGSGRAQMGIFSESGQLTGRAETNGGRMNALTALPTLNTWSHIALVFDSVSLRLYVNGIEGGALTFSTRTLNQTTDVLNVSKRVGTAQYFFDGLIDDIRIYDRALSAEDVAAIAGGGGGDGSYTYTVQWQEIP
ncbi:MAG: LamG domain-containing protein [bacterium]|nr:LamG domain-containing protein [bacterium]